MAFALVKILRRRQLAGKAWLPPQRLHAEHSPQANEDTVRTAWRHAEAGRNARPPAAAGQSSNSQDVMKLQIKVDPATGKIEDARFKTFGCGSAIASSSLATEWLKGKTIDEAQAIRNTAIVEELS